MYISRVLTALFAVSTIFSAQAGISTVTGSTAGGSTFNRPIEDGSDLSAIGTATRYSSYGFTVSVTGDYTFLTTGGFDTFSFLYSPSLNASAPLTNYLGANDDLLGTSTSGFVASLTAGTAYSFVTTGYENGDFGAFSSTIGGPGAVISSTASADPVAGVSTFAGNTTGAPTFNRALEDLSDLSSIGTAVHYDARTIRVDTSGSYTFLTTAEFDSFLFLYGASARRQCRQRRSARHHNIGLRLRFDGGCRLHTLDDWIRKRRFRRV